ncbi:MAG: hypothetical protein ABIH57_01855, partial [Candidatus Omnitrophota bacterium]
MKKTGNCLKLLLAVFFIFSTSGCSEVGDAKPAKKQNNSPESSIYSVTITDFNSGTMKNNFGGDSGTWEIDPDDKDQGITATLDEEVKMGKDGASLRLDYDVDSPENAINGFWTQLRAFDASEYDHFEFWVKGDKNKGYPNTFKIEFKKFRKSFVDGRDETVKGSYIVTGVTDKWQKFSIPLNVMNGIEKWTDIRELVITIEKNRVDKKTGTLYFDDVAFVHTGDPGGHIRDIVHHRKKKTDKDLSQLEFAQFLIDRLNGWPKKVFVKKEFPKDDTEFLKVLAKDAWGFF